MANKKEEALNKLKAKNNQVKPSQVEEQEVQEVVDPKEEAQDLEDYKAFAQMHHMTFNGKEYSNKALKPEAQKVYEKLLEKFKAKKGHKPKVSASIFLATGEDVVRIVKDIAVPDIIYKKIKEKGSLSLAKYF